MLSQLARKGHPAATVAPSPQVTARTASMVLIAADTLARVRQRYQQFVGDPRSALDRPTLADSADRFARALAKAFDDAAEQLTKCSPADPAGAASALAAAQAAEYAFDLADQHARRAARHGLYPGGTPPLDARELDLIEEARASLELAAESTDAHIRRNHCLRAQALVASAGVVIPELLEPAWTAISDDPGHVETRAHFCSTKSM
ncbi:hypothetical protein [Mycolicibacterium houstonense]|uniref:hypothetical protein n=1 Tax=Mycolicibacterium houstonense TaxID=146021 RepID=UPI000834FCE7|nr:hypothetical protein [Mycolicibacterium houstonense]